MPSLAVLAMGMSNQHNINQQVVMYSHGGEKLPFTSTLEHCLLLLITGEKKKKMWKEHPASLKENFKASFPSGSQNKGNCMTKASTRE